MHTTSHGGINSKLHNNVMNKAELVYHLMLYIHDMYLCVHAYTKILSLSLSLLLLLL